MTYKKNMGIKRKNYRKRQVIFLFFPNGTSQSGERFTIKKKSLAKGYICSSSKKASPGYL